MSYAESEALSVELLALASHKVDELTFNKINRVGFENLTSFQQERIKQAVLYQAQYYDDYGIDCCKMSGFSVLDTSISFGDSKDLNGVPVGVSPNTFMLLKQTGLMHRRV